MGITVIKHPSKLKRHNIIKLVKYDRKEGVNIVDKNEETSV